MTTSPFIYLRGLRYVVHTVFSVGDGQKYFVDPQFKRQMAYSSGQQVKRSIMEALNMPFAAITFNWEIDNKGNAGMKEPHSPCDPTFPDQLLGGYMKAEQGKSTVKRRSPLSISAMRPLHPLLGGVERKEEAVVFDRSAYPDNHVVKVHIEESGKRRVLPQQEVEKWLESNEKSLPPKYYNPRGQKRATGLFVYDIAIDLRTLFCVSASVLEPELFPDIRQKLEAEGWELGQNVFGSCYICPPEKREPIISALAKALVEWRINSNQARTFSPMETLAVAVSQNANQIAYAIRGDLDPTAQEPTAMPIIDDTTDAKLFVTPSVAGHIAGAKGSAVALEELKAYLMQLMREFPHDSQR